MKALKVQCMQAKLNGTKTELKKTNYLYIHVTLHTCKYLHHYKAKEGYVKVFCFFLILGLC